MKRESQKSINSNGSLDMSFSNTSINDHEVCLIKRSWVNYEFVASFSPNTVMLKIIYILQVFHFTEVVLTTSELLPPTPGSQQRSEFTP